MGSRVDVEEGTGCVARRLECRSGVLLIVSCSEAGILGSKLVKKEKFSGISSGTLIPSYEEDWSRAYFLYVDDTGRGIYLEGDMDVFDDPLCAAEALPLISTELRRVVVSEARRALLEQVLARRVFRYT